MRTDAGVTANQKKAAVTSLNLCRAAGDRGFKMTAWLGTEWPPRGHRTTLQEGLLMLHVHVPRTQLGGLRSQHWQNCKNK